MICLQSITAEHKSLLWTFLQNYLREMSAFHDLKPDAAGNYPYRYFEAYFTEPQRRPYFILDDQDIAGFAMINPYPYVGQDPVTSLAEFYILPEHRGKSIGLTAAAQILQTYKGSWQIKYSEKNAAAKALWQKATAKYNPSIYHIDDCETVLSFSTL